MRIKDFALKLIRRMADSLKRFYVPCAFCLLCFVLLSAEIISVKSLSEKIDRLIYSCPLGIFSGVFASLLKSEKRPSLIKAVRITLPAGLFAVGFVARFFIGEDYLAYYNMAVLGICGVMLFLTMFLLSMRRDEKPLFGHLLKSFVFVQCVCLIIFVGLSLCIWAFDSLIYSLNSPWKLYEITGLFCHLLLAFCLFVSFIPEEDEQLKSEGLYTLLVYKVAFPVYLLLLAILYAYFGKIIFTWNLPSGKINWFSSFALLFYVFFYLSLRSEETRPAVIFVKYAGIAMAPVVILQLTAIIIRLREYGFTSPRVLSLAFIAIGVAFMADSVLKKNPKTAYLFGAIVIFTVTLTPLNCIDIPIYNQTAIIKEVLTQNDMLKEGEIIPNPDLSPEQRDRIRSAHEYLRQTEGRLSEFAQRAVFAESRDFEAAYGFPYEEEREDERDYNRYFASYEEKIDISGYSMMRPFSCDSRSSSITIGEEDFDIYDYLIALKALYPEGMNSNSSLLFSYDDERDLYFTNINVEYDREKNITYLYCEGYLFIN